MFYASPGRGGCDPDPTQGILERARTHSNISSGVWDLSPVPTGFRSSPVVPGHWGLSPVPTGVCQWNQVTRKIILHVPQRVRQARAHGVREGAEEAVRQLRQRLAALSTDVESRKAGLTHRQWEWISS